VGVIEGHDKDLARQIRRAANSVALNLAESQGSDRGNRKARLHTALGSARETLTGFRLAVAWGYVGGEQAVAVDAALDRVAAMTFGLLRV
jgi:four helix bundle protein